MVFCSYMFKKSYGKASCWKIFWHAATCCEMAGMSQCSWFRHTVFIGIYWLNFISTWRKGLMYFHRTYPMNCRNSTISVQYHWSFIILCIKETNNFNVYYNINNILSKTKLWLIWIKKDFHNNTLQYQRNSYNLDLKWTSLTNSSSCCLVD